MRSIVETVSDSVVRYCLFFFSITYLPNSIIFTFIFFYSYHRYAFKNILFPIYFQLSVIYAVVSVVCFPSNYLLRYNFSISARSLFRRN